MVDPDPARFITYWRTPGSHKELPDLDPGDECDHVILPQRFIVLHSILVHDPSLVLVRLGVGAEPDVPFEQASVTGEERRYKLKDLDVLFFDRRLAKVGAAAIGADAIAIPPGMEVRLQLRNVGPDPIKPRAALVVQEEETR